MATFITVWQHFIIYMCSSDIVRLCVFNNSLLQVILNTNPVAGRGEERQEEHLSRHRTSRDQPCLLLAEWSVLAGNKTLVF